MVTRRQAMTWLAGAALIDARAADDTAAKDTAYADPASADGWMQSWISDAKATDPGATKAPNGALHVGRFADPVYYLVTSIGWDPGVHDAATHKPVRVPIGFVTDFASIPRLFWSALRPDGLHSYAAVIHDYLYWEQYVSREDADAIFKLCMEDFRINRGTIVAIHTAVRVGGGSAWSNNAKLKLAGERRVLKKTPDDPTILWQQWKQRPDVF